MKHLLIKEPEMRLGSGERDADEVKSHAFFRGVNWDDLLHKRIPPPFVPMIVSFNKRANYCGLLFL
jgi:hypothetical protein